MKNIFKLSLLSLIVIVLIASCKKEEERVVYTGGTAPVLAASSTSPLVLAKVNQADPAITFSWTNPNYQFSTGVSSQDVTYTFQIDTAGSNFVNPNMSETAISKELMLSLTVGDLNKKLLSMNLTPGVAYNLQMRVKSSLGTASVPFYSNVIKINVKPYLDAAVTPPGTEALGYADGKLFLVGSASPGGWNNPVPVPTQQFTKIDATHYKITISLLGGQEFLLLPVNGDWGVKYGNACGSNSCNAPAGDTFKTGGDNIKGPATAGTYTIDVNFISGKFTVQ